MSRTATGPWRPTPVDGVAAAGRVPAAETPRSLSSGGESLRSAWHLVRARPRLHPPKELHRWGDRLAWCLTQPGRPRSWQPLVFPCMPGAGKLGLSYGATLVGRGVAGGQRSAWVPGAVVMGLAACIVLWGIVALGNAVGHVHRPAGPWFKLSSIAGGMAMGAGYGLSGYAAARPHAAWAYGVSIALKWLGTGMTAFTLPTFVVHGVAVLGDMPFHRHRGAVGAGLLALGVPTLVASPSIVGHPGLPPAVTQAVVVLASFACLLGAGIESCALPSFPFQPTAHRLAPSRLRRHGGTFAAAATVVGVAGTVACSSMRWGGQVSAAEAQAGAGAAGTALVVAASLYLHALPPWWPPVSSTPLGIEAMPDTPSPPGGSGEVLPEVDGGLQMVPLDGDKV